MSDETSRGQDAAQEYEPDILTLEDENGTEHAFEVLDATDVGDERYLALVPYSPGAADKLAEDNEMIIMRVGEEDGDEYLDVVDDEEELLAVGQVFLNRLSEVYDIDLEELRKELAAEEE